ncbi:hypothetical protein AXJ14_gp157 [Geobacillus virus E3]|uniref:hypothetical protein n=1 Tax=Geobacillus virus E3 TaxID=1572712 RepID=UPI000671ABBA|nr:hypothetical protein AXJ14_gp157 [Geobacillus virus E3]AJA41476.1 hypothetical protein E3_0157 [Geobacillus virus E3]
MTKVIGFHNVAYRNTYYMSILICLRFTFQNLCHCIYFSIFMFNFHAYLYWI